VPRVRVRQSASLARLAGPSTRRRHLHASPAAGHQP